MVRFDRFWRVVEVDLIGLVPFLFNLIGNAMRGTVTIYTVLNAPLLLFFALTVCAWARQTLDLELKNPKATCRIAMQLLSTWFSFLLLLTIFLFGLSWIYSAQPPAQDPFGNGDFKVRGEWFVWVSLVDAISALISGLLVEAWLCFWNGRGGKH